MHDFPGSELPRAASEPDISSAQRVADAVLGVAGVVELHAGTFGQLATYLPGGRVGGVVLDDAAGSVHVVIDIRQDLLAVADEVQRVASEVAGVPMAVTVEDVSVGTEIQRTSEVKQNG